MLHTKLCGEAAAAKREGLMKVPGSNPGAATVPPLAGRRDWCTEVSPCADYQRTDSRELDRHLALDGQRLGRLGGPGRCAPSSLVGSTPTWGASSVGSIGRATRGSAEGAGSIPVCCGRGPEAGSIGAFLGSIGFDVESKAHLNASAGASTAAINAGKPELSTTILSRSKQQLEAVGVVRSPSSPTGVSYTGEDHGTPAAHGRHQQVVEAPIPRRQRPLRASRAATRVSEDVQGDFADPGSIPGDSTEEYQ